jgi:plasmid stabilization system protein ParE
MKSYRFLPEATSEYEDAIEFYENAQTGLGEAFIHEITRVIDLLMELPNMGSPVARTPPKLNVRRRIVRRFGIEIDYIVSGDVLIVLTIFHGKRHPDHWRDRLSRVR